MMPGTARPLVSVVIPAFNPSASLKEAVDSALGQDYPALEVIVVDDGSTVDTGWIARAWGDRIRYMRKANGGPASARNAGVAQARGEYVAFLDADDIWEAGKVSEQARILEERPEVGLVYGPVTRVDGQGRPVRAVVPHQPSGRIFEALFMGNVIPTSTVMARRRCLEALGGFEESRELISVEDYDMWLRIAERYDVAALDRPLTRYRVHQAGISRNTIRSYAGEAAVIERAVARHRGEPFVARVLRPRLARLWFNCGHEYFHTDRLADARGAFARSLAYRCWQPAAWGYWAATWMGAPLLGAVRRVKRGRAPATAAQPLRLMHVLFTLKTGGAEYVALNLMRGLDPQRYALHVCSLSGEGELAPAFRALGVTVHALTKRPGVDLGVCFALAGLFRRERIAVVHTHNATPWLYAGVAAWLSGARLYHTEHSNLFPHQRRLMLAERLLALWTRCIIADSEKVRRFLIERQGIPARKVVTVLNGIDASAFADGGSPAAARAALGVDERALVVGTVGRLAAVKDQATMLEAFRRVAAAQPGALLLIAGDGPLRASLEAQAAALGIAARVKFLGRRTDVPQVMRAFDVFALSSVSEGLPLTVLEAMAAGIPVVATDVGALREVVTGDAYGLLVPPKSPERLADALITMLGNGAMRAAISRAGRERVRAEFDVARMTQRYEAAYHHQSVS